MLFCVFSLVSIMILNESFAQENTTLLLVQSLFRHGDRSPIYMYPNDPNTLDSWPDGIGQLTLLGKKQQYAVGKYLRSMYKGFVTSDPKEVFVRSSASERCLTSAESQLASFYAPEEKWKIDDDLNWQPIPVHYLPKEQDKLLSFGYMCPKMQVEFLRIHDAIRTNELLQKHQMMEEAIFNQTGLHLFEGFNTFLLYDTLFIEKLHNLPTPEWVDTYWDELEEFAIMSFWNLLNSTLTMRLRGGPLLQEISKNMMKKINGDIPDLKVQVYSAHDVILGTVLLALNFTSLPRPPYCAVLLFELHQMADNSKAVRLLYLNSTDPLTDMGNPQVLSLDHCEEFCPVEEFTKNIQHLFVDDWEQECQNNE